MADKQKVAVLCAMPNSIYNRFRGVEVFDEQRDARTFRGGMSVVTHPPCRHWGNLSHLAATENKRAEMQLGLFCVEQVRKWGGVLEHPAHSRLWDAAKIVKPGWTHNRPDEFTLEIPQFWFGHKGIKLTWLYVVGVRYEDLPPAKLFFRRKPHPVEDLCHRLRSATPEHFARWLLSIARQAKVN